MRVVFDSVMLSLFLDPSATPPKPIDRPQARIQLLVDTLSEAQAKILLPTPALSEFLVVAGSQGPTYLSEIASSAVFEIVPFDLVAAVEAAAQTAKALAAGDKKAGAKGTWQKVKVDRQIVAIAKVHAADCIYSDDGDVVNLALAAGLQVLGIESLPTPPEDNAKLPLGEGE